MQIVRVLLRSPTITESARPRRNPKRLGSERISDGALLSDFMKVGIDKKAYIGAPVGYRRNSFPDGQTPILHPSQWNRTHWSFDNDLRTKAKRSHVPMTANEALNLISQIMSATQSVGK